MENGLNNKMKKIKSQNDLQMTSKSNSVSAIRKAVLGPSP